MTPSTSSPSVRRNAREIVVITLVVAAVVGGFYLVYRFRVIAFLLLAAFILNIAISPAVDWLVRKGRSRPLAVALVYLALLIAVSLFVILVGPMLVDQATDFAAKIPEYYQRGQKLLIESPNYVLKRIALILPVTPELAVPAVQTEAEAFNEVAGFLGNAATAVRFLLIGATIFVLAYYWNLESQRVELWLLRFAPAERRERIRATVDEIEATVGAFLAGQLLLGLLIGIASPTDYRREQAIVACL